MRCSFNLSNWHRNVTFTILCFAHCWFYVIQLCSSCTGHIQQWQRRKDRKKRQLWKIDQTANGPWDVRYTVNNVFCSQCGGTLLKWCFMRLLALLSTFFPLQAGMGPEMTLWCLLYLVLFWTSLQDEITVADKQPLRTLTRCTHSYSVSNQTWIYHLPGEKPHVSDHR